MAECQESNLCWADLYNAHRRMATIVIAPAAAIRIEQAEHDQVERHTARGRSSPIATDTMVTSGPPMANQWVFNALLMFVDAPRLVSL